MSGTAVSAATSAFEEASDLLDGLLANRSKDDLRSLVEALHEVELTACRLRLALQIEAGEKVT